MKLFCLPKYDHQVAAIQMVHEKRPCFQDRAFRQEPGSAGGTPAHPGKAREKRAKCGPKKTKGVTPFENVTPGYNDVWR
jgi:hypothetical protein